MKISALLSPDELSQFNDLVNQAAAKGAQAVRWYRNVSMTLLHLAS